MRCPRACSPPLAVEARHRGIEVQTRTGIVFENIAGDECRSVGGDRHSAALPFINGSIGRDREGDALIAVSRIGGAIGQQHHDA